MSNNWQESIYWFNSIILESTEYDFDDKVHSVALLVPNYF